MGWSGARPEVAEAIARAAERGLTPVVPEHGSLGASGDLAPLAHCALALIGEGSVSRLRRRRAARGRGAGRRRASSRSSSAAKEGLALINGTDGMLGMLVLAMRGPAASCCGSRTSPPRCRSRRCWGPTARSPRTWSRSGPSPGQAASAANLRALLADSEIVASHRVGRPARPGRLLAALRAAGDRRGARHARRTPTRRGRRGAALGDRQPDGAARRPRRVMRQLPRRAGRATRATSWRSRPPRSARSPSAAPTGCSTRRRSHGLPPFLADDPGVDSGMMLAHYAQAAIVAENRRLAAPASVDSLPTSAMQEDHVSMGWGAARKLRVAVDGPASGARGRARVRRAGARSARAAASRAGDRRRARRAAARGRARARPVHGARSGGGRGARPDSGESGRGELGVRHGPSGPRTLGSARIRSQTPSRAGYVIATL